MDGPQELKNRIDNEAATTSVAVGTGRIR